MCERPANGYLGVLRYPVCDMYVLSDGVHVLSGPLSVLTLEIVSGSVEGVAVL